jgi:hypothetical protein
MTEKSTDKHKQLYDKMGPSGLLNNNDDDDDDDDDQ